MPQIWRFSALKGFVSACGDLCGHGDEHVVYSLRNKLFVEFLDGLLVRWWAMVG